MLPTHLSIPEIAGELFLSPNTIKSQANSIYRKLGASTRSQAVTRARELKLRVGAEGVRTFEQAARLRQLGVIAARGSFISDSATGDEVDELIARHSRGD